MSPSAGASARLPEPLDFFRWIHGLVLAGDPRVRRLGPVKDSMRDGLSELASSVRRSVWHLTDTPTWSEVRAARDLATVTARRGIDGRYATPPRSLDRLPMLSSHHPGLRVGPVPGPLLVVDSRVVFVGAPRGSDLEGQVFMSSTPHVTSAAAACVDAVWAQCVPVRTPDEPPPFTRRMVEIGFLLTDGATDREIAKALGVSERTVSAQVAEITRRLGARNRGHAIALIGGGRF